MISLYTITEAEKANEMDCKMGNKQLNEQQVNKVFSKPRIEE